MDGKADHGAHSTTVEQGHLGQRHRQVGTLNGKEAVGAEVPCCMTQPGSRSSSFSKHREEAAQR